MQLPTENDGLNGDREEKTTFIRKMFEWNSSRWQWVHCHRDLIVWTSRWMHEFRISYQQSEQQNHLNCRFNE